MSWLHFYTACQTLGFNFRLTMTEIFAPFMVRLLFLKVKCIYCSGNKDCDYPRLAIMDRKIQTSSSATVGSRV